MFKPNDRVRVEPFQTFQWFKGAEILSAPIIHEHAGYAEAMVIDIFTDGSAEIFVPSFGVDMVPYKALRPYDPKLNPVLVQNS